MAKVHALFVRQAGVTLLKRAAVVGPGPLEAAGIFPEQRPANVPWPFIGWGAPIEVPFLASGMDGSAVTVSVHAYAETSGVGDDTRPGADMANALIGWVVETLGGDEGAEVSLAETDCPHPATAYFTWTGSQCVQDGADAGAFHAWATFDVAVRS